MRVAILIMALMLLPEPAAWAEVRVDCGDFTRQPDGGWTATKATGLALLNAERRTQAHFAIAAGTKIPPGKVLSDHDQVDLAAEIDRRCH